MNARIMASVRGPRLALKEPPAGNKTRCQNQRSRTNKREEAGDKMTYGPAPRRIVKTSPALPSRPSAHPPSQPLRPKARTKGCRASADASPRVPMWTAPVALPERVRRALPNRARPTCRRTRKPSDPSGYSRRNGCKIFHTSRLHHHYIKDTPTIPPRFSSGAQSSEPCFRPSARLHAADPKKYRTGIHYTRGRASDNAAKSRFTAAISTASGSKAPPTDSSMALCSS